MPRGRRRKAHATPQNINQVAGSSTGRTLTSLKLQDNIKTGLRADSNTRSILDDVENHQPTKFDDQKNVAGAGLSDELENFRQEWKRELGESKSQGDNVSENIGPIKPILNNDISIQPMKLIDHVSTDTTDLHNEVDSFRQKWRRDLEDTKPRIDSPSDIYAEAKRLFLKAVELEQDDMHHESIRFYKQAMHLCPDIEKQIFREECDASKKAVPNVDKNGESVSPDNHKDDSIEKVRLYERIQRNFHEDMKEDQLQVYCRPKNKLKPGMLHMSHLPRELILQIFRYVIGEELDLSSLESLGSASRGLYLLSNDRSLWRSICCQIWGDNIKIDNDCGNWEEDVGETDCVQINWRQMFLERPRVNYDGVYISRTRYIRQGDVGFQDITYRPFHVIRYYRYLRFFPDKRVLILTTNEEPDKIIPIFRSALYSKQFSSELSILEGSYEFLNAKHINIVAEKDCRSSLNLSQNQRRKVQLDWYRQTPISQKFNLRFELKTSESRPYKNNVLKWLEYTILNRMESGQDITSFDLSPDTFPSLVFSRVKKFNLRLTNPLSSH